MAAWLAETIGGALSEGPARAPDLTSDVVVQFNDGQPLLALPHRLQGAQRNDLRARALTDLVNTFPTAVAPPRSPEALGDLVAALAAARRESPAVLRAAWHGLVCSLFPDELAEHRVMVELLHHLDSSGIDALLR